MHFDEIVFKRFRFYDFFHLMIRNARSSYSILCILTVKFISLFRTQNLGTFLVGADRHARTENFGIKKFRFRLRNDRFGVAVVRFRCVGIAVVSRFVIVFDNRLVIVFYNRLVVIFDNRIVVIFDNRLVIIVFIRNHIVIFIRFFQFFFNINKEKCISGEMSCSHHYRIACTGFHDRIARCSYHNRVSSSTQPCAITLHDRITGSIQHYRVTRSSRQNRIASRGFSCNFNRSTCRAVAPLTFRFPVNRCRHHRFIGFSECLFAASETYHRNRNRLLENYAGRLEFYDFADDGFAFSARIILGFVNFHRDSRGGVKSFCRNFYRNTSVGTFDFTALFGWNFLGDLFFKHRSGTVVLVVFFFLLAAAGCNRKNQNKNKNKAKNSSHALLLFKKLE